MVVALWIAILTHYLVEYPLRRLPLRKAMWLGIAFLTSSVTAAAGLVVGITAVASLGATASVRVSVVGDPFTGRAKSGPVYPSVLDAVNDTPHYPASCILSLTATKSPACIIGPNGSAVSGRPNSNRVVLIGDSHAGQWFAAIHSFAAANNWSVEVLNKEGCPLASITVINPTLARPYTECNVWRLSVFRRLAQEPRPKIIFISSLNWYVHDKRELQTGWSMTLRALKATGAPIVYLEDTPYPTINVPICVSGALSDWSKCDFPRVTALRPDPLLSGSLRRYLAAVVDINQFLCPGTGPKCPSVLGGILLYRDESHLSNTAMVVLSPSVEAQLNAAKLVPKRTSNVASG